MKRKREEENAEASTSGSGAQANAEDATREGADNNEPPSTGKDGDSLP